jgi:hypothetical protein
MENLEKFKRPPQKKTSTRRTSTVRVSEAHQTFMRDNDLSMSKILEHAIQTLIDGKYTKPQGIIKSKLVG